MKFEIPFDYEIYKKQMDIYFELSWENLKRNNRLHNYFGFGLLLIGILWLIESPSVKIIFPLGLIIIGTYSLISYCRFYFPYLKSKRNFKNEVNEISKEYLKNPIAQLEFTEDGLIVKDYFGERKLLWADYNFCKVIGKTLIVTGEKNPIVINEEEIGNANFKKVVKFVVDALEKPAANSDFSP